MRYYESLTHFFVFSVFIFCVLTLLSQWNTKSAEQEQCLNNTTESKLETKQESHVPKTDIIIVDKQQIFRKTLHAKFVLNIVNVDQPFGAHGIFEFDWIVNVLLGRIERPLDIVDMSHISNDTLTVFLFKPPEHDYFDELKELGFINQGAFHMGDETMSNNISYYPKANYVFRNYYNADYLKKYPNAHWVPLGTKSGYGQVLDPQTLVRASERRELCNFVGTRHVGRHETIDIIIKRGVKCRFEFSKKWGDSNGMPIHHYRNLVRDSKFTLAPWGGNPESLRLYEALEVGSIPIFQKFSPLSQNTLTAFGPDCPIPQFDNWNQAADFILQMSNATIELDELQDKIISFWYNFKKQIQLKIKNVIDRSFREAHGYSC